MIFSFANASDITRASRLGKLYKIIRIVRMARLVKTVKFRNKLSKSLKGLCKISQGAERIFAMLLTFTILQHIAACIW